MRTASYTVRTTTPTFLGNARQDAQWRTPPIKALLRQWWRVAYAAEKNFAVNVAEMRHEEGLLFGHAWLEDDASAARKSQVRIRLSHWGAGTLKEWQATGRTTHPEVKNPVGTDLYLGYGPLAFEAGRSCLKANAAIQTNESVELSLAYQTDVAARIGHALYLIHQFGTVGGRSRNGWGSLHLTPHEGTSALQGDLPLREWQKALKLDWPHAIGKDSHGALVWQTRPHADWKSLMRELAEIKIGLRTQFRFTTGRNASVPESRHWLSYPVTNHSVQPWGSNARLPNSLRFKVRAAPDHPGQLAGVIFHMPCMPPPAFQVDPDMLASVWQQVHAFLDLPARNLTRIAA